MVINYTNNSIFLWFYSNQKAIICYKIYLPTPFDFLWIEKRRIKGAKRDQQRKKRKKKQISLLLLPNWSVGFFSTSSKPIPPSFLNSIFLSHTDTQFNLCFPFAHTLSLTLPLKHICLFPQFIYLSLLCFPLDFQELPLCTLIGNEKFHLYLIENQEKLWIRHSVVFQGFLDFLEVLF